MKITLIILLSLASYSWAISPECKSPIISPPIIATFDPFTTALPPIIVPNNYNNSGQVILAYNTQRCMDERKAEEGRIAKELRQVKEEEELCGPLRNPMGRPTRAQRMQCENFIREKYLGIIRQAAPTLNEQGDVLAINPDYYGTLVASKQVSNGYESCARERVACDTNTNGQSEQECFQQYSLCVFQVGRNNTVKQENIQLIPLDVTPVTQDFYAQPSGYPMAR